jgi:hypothetical protein
VGNKEPRTLSPTICGTPQDPCYAVVRVKWHMVLATKQFGSRKLARVQQAFDDMAQQWKASHIPIFQLKVKF